MGLAEKQDKSWQWAVLIAAAHVALALAYAWWTPYCMPGITNGKYLSDIGAPDERAHAHYVKHIFDGKGLPVLVPGSQDLETTYENHQPPLYYQLAAGWCRLAGVSDPTDPEQGFRVRMLGALLGGTTILGVFWLGLVSTRKREVALGAAAVSASLPMLCAVDGSVSMDPLFICLCTWVLAIVARSMDGWSLWRVLGVGLLVASAIVTKLAGLLLLPAIGLGVLFQPVAVQRALGLASLVPALALPVPWFQRNLELYGDLLGLKTFYATFTRDVWPEQVFSGLRPFAHWLYVLVAGTAQSFVGQFGYMDIHLPYWIYAPVWVLVGLALVSSIKSGERIEPRPARVVCSAFVVLLVLGYLSYNLWQVQPQARYLFPAIGVLSIWMVFGARRIHGLGPWVLAGALLLANLYSIATLPGQFQERVRAASQAGAPQPEPPGK